MRVEPQPILRDQGPGPLGVIGQNGRAQLLGAQHALEGHQPDTWSGW